MKGGLAVAPGLLAETLEDATGLFNPRTWRTHVLNGPAATLFDYLRAHPGCSKDQLADVLMRPAEDAGQFDHAVEQAIGSMIDLGLVVAV